jgi:hypothetical protein|tara:strand:- start:213 stop:437 length:225 start_codon:yes stop_codon:yes gene_type:complete
MTGIEVDTAMKWLNVSRSYIYRMVKSEELKTVTKKPLLINPNSIIKKINNAYPEVTKNCFSILDYSVKQDVVTK